MNCRPFIALFAVWGRFAADLASATAKGKQPVPVT
jgi:hypothetical protein